MVRCWYEERGTKRKYDCETIIDFTKCKYVIRGSLTKGKDNVEDGIVLWRLHSIVKAWNSFLVVAAFGTEEVLKINIVLDCGLWPIVSYKPDWGWGW